MLKVREIAMPYPDAVEATTWGRPTYRVGKKIFVFVGETMANPFSIVFKPAPEEKGALLADARFFIPRYFGVHGWLAMHIEADDTDWRQVAELIDTSYRQLALVRHLRRLDSEGLSR